VVGTPEQRAATVEENWKKVWGYHISGVISFTLAGIASVLENDTGLWDLIVSNWGTIGFVFFGLVAITCVWAKQAVAWSWTLRDAEPHVKEKFARIMRGTIAFSTLACGLFGTKMSFTEYYQNIWAIPVLFVALGLTCFFAAGCYTLFAEQAKSVYFPELYPTVKE
jgi:hypothetical protein